MDSKIVVDALIEQLGVNELIHLYVTESYWKNYLDEQVTLNNLATKYKFDHGLEVSSFPEFVRRYDQKTIYRLCLDRYGICDCIQCLIKHIENKNYYAFDVIFDRCKARINSNSFYDLLKAAVKAQNSYSTDKLISLDRVDHGFSVCANQSFVAELFRYQLKMKNKSILIGLITLIKKFYHHILQNVTYHRVLYNAPYQDGDFFLSKFPPIIRKLIVSDLTAEQIADILAARD